MATMVTAYKLCFPVQHLYVRKACQKGPSPDVLAAFPAQDTLPLMLWGNGGCAIDGARYSEFLGAIANWDTDSKGLE